jgi:hypothetical protein
MYSSSLPDRDGIQCAGDQYSNTVLAQKTTHFLIGKLHTIVLVSVPYLLPPTNRYHLIMTDDNLVINDSYMSEAQLSNLCKRQHTEQHPLPSPPLSKRQKKLYHSLGYIEPPAFWDSLSKIWLTKDALRELDRRNTPSRLLYHQARRPITRNFLAEQRNTHRRISVKDPLSHCSPSRVKDIKRFARYGGPNLSDLIGVCTAEFVMFRDYADDNL